MNYTRQEVLDFVREEDVKFIRLAFCDIFGNQKNVSIMADELERALEGDISFDASAIKGFASEEDSDMFLQPDPSLFSLLPWRPSRGKVARLYCDVVYPDGRAYELDCRQLLKRAVKAAAQKGITVYFGTEYEFYLFKTDEDGCSTKIPFDRAGYMDIAPDDAGENVRREICLTLEEMGIRPEASHHEEGPGQNEIDFKYSDALTAADNANTFKTVVKNTAARNGLSADFSPKPLKDFSGNGMHVNMSVHSINGVDYSAQFMAGILKHICEMTAFLNPSTESYERLGSHKAPLYVTWSSRNRSQLIRIPASREAAGKRIELRSPDSNANPYLAYALLIFAGLEGIDNKLTPAPASSFNPFTVEKSVADSLEKLPDSLNKAQEIAAKSEFIKKYLPAKLIDGYCCREA